MEQLELPGLRGNPTRPELAFLELARQWHVEASKTKYAVPLPSSADLRAQSCLLLAVEWGAEFSQKAQNMAESCSEAVAEGPYARFDRLSWKLCNCAAAEKRWEATPVETLVENLDHPSSSIRIWMMKLAWFVHPWLNVVETSVHLCRNLADTLAWPLMAAGLAAHCYGSWEGFLSFAREYKDVERKEQYKIRLQQISEVGELSVQAPFWKLESECRKQIELVSFMGSHERHSV
jgi:hypothetical protein